MHKFKSLTEPFRDDEFDIFQRGISDNPSIDVYLNQQKDFALLYPVPSMDYNYYIPRAKKFGLTAYKKSLHIERRFHKIENHLQIHHHSLLEIGAGDGTFLKTVKKYRPHLHMTAVDKDQNTLQSRVQNSDENHDSLEQLMGKSLYFDIICLFHVLEHILTPLDFLSKIHELMLGHSLLIIEVPSIHDPLLSLYNNEAFSKFYFSSQHPHVYSPSSLQRLMEYSDFQTVEVLNFQRYGLENHLNWLSRAKPGGNKQFQRIFEGLDSEYIAALEQYGKTDTVLWVGKKGDK
jgi:hypothetical protein